ncbi:hypothetical protein [Pelosinus sp. sgz500959]|uniref:hypothetical protein n=1 Tax=Pelosinus sp. sgz500959 TaxID=3242472 RepID=UPI00366D1E81
MAKGPYHRHIGRHTQKFCSKAVKRSNNETQKKIFFVAAICADELIASLIGVDNKRQIAPFKVRKLKNKILKPHITMALRIYMSALLTLISVEKKLLLQQTGMDEDGLLQAWCWIFEYLPSDMKLFDEVMMPSYQQGGIERLGFLVGKELSKRIFEDDHANSPEEIKILQDIMVEDAAVIMGLLQINNMEAV